MDVLKSPIPYHTNLKVKYSGGPIKVRNTYLITGVSPGQDFCAYNNSILSMARAVNERLMYICENGVYREPPQPEPGHFSSTLEVFAKRFDRLTSFTHPLSYSQFVDCYHGQKRVRYQKASEVLGRRSIEHKDAYQKQFAKYDTFDRSTTNDSVPRGINPRSDEFLVEAGRYFKPIEKKEYKIIEEIFGHKVVMKGMNQSERGRIIAEYFNSFDKPVAISLDASRFEQSVTVDALRWEHTRHQKFYPGDKLFKKLTRWQLHNIGTARSTDGTLKFHCEGRRGSGDPNTASGNCLISAGMVWQIMYDLEIINYKVVLDGDDVVVFMDTSNLERFMGSVKGWYRRMAFRMKVENPVYRVEHIDFCQSRPVCVDGEYLMVRNIRNSLSKDAVCKKNLNNEKVYYRWMSAVGQGGVAVNGGVPIAQSYYSCFERAGLGHKPLDDAIDPWNQANKYRGMNRKAVTVSDYTRYSFYLAFNITPDEQIAVEKYYDQLVLSYGLPQSELDDYPSVLGALISKPE